MEKITKEQILKGLENEYEISGESIHYWLNFEYKQLFIENGNTSLFQYKDIITLSEKTMKHYLFNEFKKQAPNTYYIECLNSKKTQFKTHSIWENTLNIWEAKLNLVNSYKHYMELCDREDLKFIYSEDLIEEYENYFY